MFKLSFLDLVTLICRTKIVRRKLYTKINCTIVVYIQNCLPGFPSLCHSSKSSLLPLT